MSIRSYFETFLNFSSDEISKSCRQSAEELKKSHEIGALRSEKKLIIIQKNC